MTHGRLQGRRCTGSSGSSTWKTHWRFCNMGPNQQWWKKDLTHTGEVHPFTYFSSSHARKIRFSHFCSSRFTHSLFFFSIQDKISCQRQHHILPQSNRVLPAAFWCHLRAVHVDGDRGRPDHLAQPCVGCKCAVAPWLEALRLMRLWLKICFERQPKQAVLACSLIVSVSERSFWTLMARDSLFEKRKSNIFILKK